MNHRVLSYFFLTLFLLGIGILTAGGGIKPQYKPTEKAFYLKPDDVQWIRPGLNLVIQKVEVNAPSVAVTFRISDDQNQGLDRLGIATPGRLVIGFTLARIRPGDQQYTSYYQIPANGICQPKDFTDGSLNTSGVYVGTGGINCTYGPGGGTYESLGDGVYRYTMALKLPANYDVGSTTTLGMWASRVLEDFDLGVPNANAVYTFVPSGAPMTQVREIVTTAACNQCHDPLGAHGLPPTDFDRRDVRICILCHTADKINPETGNTLDERVFIHKIHMGANLPSVSGKPLSVFGISGSAAAAPASGATQTPIPAGYDPANLKSVGLGGKPFQIGVTSENEVFDGSTIVWPQDVRNCTTCHQGGAQSDNWKTNPSRAACGSCHDDVNFDSGKNHAGGVQADDSKCSTCHPADTGAEFDLSVAGVHTIPTNSKKLAGLNIKISGVTNASPGSRPTVSFAVANNDGSPVDITKLDRLAFQIAGPTSDYTFFFPPGSLEDARKATASSTGYSYTFQATLPKDAKGTFAVGAEGYRTVSYSGSLAGQSFSVRETAFNPVSYFSVDGSKVAPRRKVVDLDKCNVCHKPLSLHGGIRRNTEYCVLCHNPKDTDEERRPASAKPDETINFRTMVHRIHMGVAAEGNDYSVYGFGGTPISFGGTRYPADPRNCAKCHVDNPPTFTVPLPEGLADTETPAFFYSPLQPTASACLGCHNADHAAAHAYQMTAPFGESCPVCHQEGADFAVTKVHARDTIWPPEDAK